MTLCQLLPFTLLLVIVTCDNGTPEFLKIVEHAADSIDGKWHVLYTQSHSEFHRVAWWHVSSRGVNITTCAEITKRDTGFEVQGCPGVESNAKLFAILNASATEVGVVWPEDLLKQPQPGPDGSRVPLLQQNSSMYRHQQQQPSKPHDGSKAFPQAQLRGHVNQNQPRAGLQPREHHAPEGGQPRHQSRFNDGNHQQFMQAHEHPQIATSTGDGQDGSPISAHPLSSHLAAVGMAITVIVSLLVIIWTHTLPLSKHAVLFVGLVFIGCYFRGDLCIGTRRTRELLRTRECIVAELATNVTIQSRTKSNNGVPYCDDVANKAVVLMMWYGFSVDTVDFLFVCSWCLTANLIVDMVALWDLPHPWFFAPAIGSIVYIHGNHPTWTAASLPILQAIFHSLLAGVNHLHWKRAMLAGLIGGYSALVYGYFAANIVIPLGLFIYFTRRPKEPVVLLLGFTLVLLLHHNIFPLSNFVSGFKLVPYDGGAVSLCGAFGIIWTFSVPLITPWISPSTGSTQHDRVVMSITTVFLLEIPNQYCHTIPVVGLSWALVGVVFYFGVMLAVPANMSRSIVPHALLFLTMVWMINVHLQPMQMCLLFALSAILHFIPDNLSTTTVVPSTGASSPVKRSHLQPVDLELGEGKRMIESEFPADNQSWVCELGPRDNPLLRTVCGGALVASLRLAPLSIFAFITGLVYVLHLWNFLLNKLKIKSSKVTSVVCCSVWAWSMVTLLLVAVFNLGDSEQPTAASCKTGTYRELSKLGAEHIWKQKVQPPALSKLWAASEGIMALLPADGGTSGWEKESDLAPIASSIFSNATSTVWDFISDAQIFPHAWPLIAALFVVEPEDLFIQDWGLYSRLISGKLSVRELMNSDTSKLDTATKTERQRLKTTTVVTHRYGKKPFRQHRGITSKSKKADFGIWREQPTIVRHETVALCSRSFPPSVDSIEKCTLATPLDVLLSGRDSDAGTTKFTITHTATNTTISGANGGPLLSQLGTDRHSQNTGTLGNSRQANKNSHNSLSRDTKNRKDHKNDKNAHAIDPPLTSQSDTTRQISSSLPRGSQNHASIQSTHGHTNLGMTQATSIADLFEFLTRSLSDQDWSAHGGKTLCPTSCGSLHAINNYKTTELVMTVNISLNVGAVTAMGDADLLTAFDTAMEKTAESSDENETANTRSEVQNSANTTQSPLASARACRKLSLKGSGSDSWAFEISPWSNMLCESILVCADNSPENEVKHVGVTLRPVCENHTDRVQLCGVQNEEKSPTSGTACFPSVIDTTANGVVGPTLLTTRCRHLPIHNVTTPPTPPIASEYCRINF
eukprot:TRINITY_DN46972_c0_g1_i1.p1 TRINITY_DN46972_c0_g1~~TRINITY_DN46972_c0_g1_i1.p1  ORF type:complete len:1331 (+),score=55.64 TRINITY_DN46972_c0_g1_i1:58-3993(+)